MKRVLSGIQPSNNLHLGNILGLFNTIQTMNDFDDLFFFIADLHSLTSGLVYQQHVYNIVRVFMYFLQDKNYTLYRQSDLKEFPYLQWILSCYTSFGELKNMTQFKSKNQIMNNSGLLFYPVLMAADILGVDANYVPVGPDQSQHLELTCRIGKNINKKFNKNIFIIPKPVFANFQVQNLQDISEKMSKSSNKQKGIIYLSDTPEQISEKINKAVTDNESMPINIENIKISRPEIYHLCSLYSICSNKDFTFIEINYGNKYISIFKKDLSDIIINYLNPIKLYMNNITDKKVEEILLQGKEKIAPIIKKKIIFLQKLLLNN